MMNELLRWVLSQRLLVTLFALLLIGAGVAAFNRIPIDAFPDVSPTQVKIVIKVPGMTPEEVEARVTALVEVELLGIPHQTMLRSIAKYAITDITLDFEEGTDIYWARQQVNERLGAVWGNLPANVEGGMAPMTTPLGEMFMFTVESPSLSLAERRSLLDWVIRPALRTVPGVADVNVLGGLTRAFEVIPDDARLAARDIPVGTLIEALRTNNRNDGAGRLTESEESLLVRAEGRIQTLDDVRNIVVISRDLQPIRVGDIAEVRLGQLTRYGAVTQNAAAEAVEGLVLSLRGANARQTIAGLKEKLAELQPALPPDVRIDAFYDRSHLVDRAIHTVIEALLEATVLVVVLLVLFLGDWRAAVCVASALPLAALVTFILMDQAGMSANLMSLGGLAIAIGMLVDGAVVVIENIANTLSHAGAGSRVPLLHRVYRAVREVAGPVTSGILIIAIVFLPLLSLEGLEGKLFKPVALTIVFALSGALLLSFTVIPVLASVLMRGSGHDEPWLVQRARSAYLPMLQWVLAHARPVALGLAVLLAATLVVFWRLGAEFMPVLDEGDVIVQLEKLPSIALEESARLDLMVQRALQAKVPEVQRTIARLGADELGLDPMGLNETDTFTVLKPRQEWRMAEKEALLDALRKVLEQIPGIAYRFTQPIEMRVTEMLTGVKGDVAIKLFGPDLAVLNAKAEAIAQAVQHVPGAADVFTAKNEGAQYLRVAVDRIAAGRLGLDVDTVEELLRAQVEGLKVGIVQEGVRRTPLLLRGASEAHTFDMLQIALPNGGRAPLNSVARLERVEGVVSVAREHGQRFAVVSTSVVGRDMVSFVEDAKHVVGQQVELPTGYFLQWGGQFENQQRAAKRLSIVVPVALGLIFLVLFSTFGSVRQAVLVLSNIPMALIGGVFGLWLAGEYVSVPASVGFIALLGIAVLNGVVMVSYFNQLRQQGLSMAETVVQGALRRLRPVLMTASITAFGLVPLLLATGPGSEIQRPLAVVVIGGLFTSTPLTLLLLPLIYRRFAEPAARTSNQV